MSKVKKAQRRAQLLAEIDELDTRIDALVNRMASLETSVEMLKYQLQPKTPVVPDYPRTLPRYEPPIYVGDVPPFFNITSGPVTVSGFDTLPKGSVYTVNDVEIGCNDD